MKSAGKRSALRLTAWFRQRRRPRSECRIRTATGRYVIDRERDRYSAQLKRYSAALDGGRLGLWFPLHRGWREAET